MTIQSDQRRAGPYPGNGTGTQFPFAFKVFADTELAVYLRTGATGEDSPLILDAQFSVTLNADQEATPGGYITYPISGLPLPAGSFITVLGGLAYNQSVDLPDGGRFFPDVVETGLDRGVVLSQQLLELLTRAIKLPISVLGDVSPVLPQPEAVKYLRWDSAAKKLINANGPVGPKGDDGPAGPRGATGPKGAKGDQGDKGDPGNYIGLTLIGSSTDIVDRPVSASEGEAWGLLEGGTIRIYVWTDGAWYDAGTITAPGVVPVDNVLYVTKGGNDANSGSSLSFPKLTIAAAVAAATANTLVSVYPGEYEEDGEIDLPDEVGVVSSGGQFLTKIVASAGNEQKNMLRVGSGSYVQGFSFSGQEVDDFDDPTGGFAVAFRPGATIRRSPYIRDISQISNYTGENIAAPLDPANGNPLVGRGGGVILADRAVLNPDSIFPYMLSFGATPRTPNGLGYVAKNGAGINGISSISIFSRCAFYALNGGQITLNNSGTQFGDISMRANGTTNTVDPDESLEPLALHAPSADLIATNAATIVDAVWTALVSGGYTGGWTAERETFTRRDTLNLLKSVEFDLRGGTQASTQAFVQGLFDYNAVAVFNVAIKPAFLFSFTTIEAQILSYVVDSNARTAVEGLMGLVYDTVDTPTIRAFGSLIESLGHQFNNAGAGVNKNALPLNFRRPGENRPVPFSVLQENGGRVRWSGADELNNQYFAGGTKINGQTGRFEGRPFNSAVRQIARRLANSRGSF